MISIHHRSGHLMTVKHSIHTIRPSISAISFSSVLTPITDVQVIMSCSLPYTFALPYSFLPLSIILLSILPLVLPVSMSLAFLEVTYVVIPIRMLFVTSTMPQVCFPAAFIPTAIHVDHDALAMSLLR